MATEPIAEERGAAAASVKIEAGRGAKGEQAPAKNRELTARAIAVAVVVAALMGAAEPVVVLRIGYGPNISVVSAFLRFIPISLLGLVTRLRGTRRENNPFQTHRTPPPSA